MSGILIVPGLHNSGPDHWQTWLESRLPEARRVQQADWAAPNLEQWTRQVGRVLVTGGDNIIVVAHSFGCLASIRAMQARPERIRGALLVAPADPRKFKLDPEIWKARLPFRTLVVGSENDPWMSLGRSMQLADDIGADFFNLGPAGHINVASGHGPWPGALKLIAGLGRPRIRSFSQASPGVAARSA